MHSLIAQYLEESRLDLYLLLEYASSNSLNSHNNKGNPVDDLLSHSDKYQEGIL